MALSSTIALIGTLDLQLDCCKFCDVLLVEERVNLLDD